MEDDQNYEDLLENTRPLAEKIKRDEKHDIALFDIYVTPNEQKDMLAMGFVGDFTNADLLCEEVEEPYISYDEHLADDFEGREHVQCPLFSKRCEDISKELYTGLPCEVFYQKLEQSLY